MTEFWFQVLNSGLTFAMLAVSLNLLIGFGGLFSIFHGALYGIGAYVSALIAMKLGLPFPLPMLAGAAAASLFAGLTAFPALRVTGHYLVLLTLAIQSVVTGVMLAWVNVTGGVSGLSGIPRIIVFGRQLVDPSDYTVLGLLLAAASIGCITWVGRSPFGRTLNAIRNDEIAAGSVGKQVSYYKVVAFGIAGAIAGIAGGYFAYSQAFINPGTFNLDQSILFLAMVIVGGVGSVAGSVVGAFLLAFIPSALLYLNLGQGTVGHARQLIFGALLIAIPLFRPQGLVPKSGATRRPAPPQRRPAPAAASQQTQRSRPAATQPGEDAAAGTEVVLIAEGLEKRFGGVAAAQDVNLKLRRGIITGLIGPNGAGKTTAFNLLTGSLGADGGRVTLKGEDITNLTPAQRARRGLARTYQDIRLFADMSVLDNVLVAIPEQPGDSIASLFTHPGLVTRTLKKDVETAFEHLDMVGLRGRADETVSELAFGEQKLLSLARLVATGGDVLLLDEPTSGVDRNWVDKILSIVVALKEAGKTICIVEHNMQVIQALAGHIYFMESGRVIAEGPPTEVMADEKLSRIYFGGGVAG